MDCWQNGLGVFPLGFSYSAVLATIWMIDCWQKTRVLTLPYYRVGAAPVYMVDGFDLIKLTIFLLINAMRLKLAAKPTK